MGRLLRISPWTLEKLTERTEKLPESGKFCRVKATFSALRRLRPKRVNTLPLKNLPAARTGLEPGAPAKVKFWNRRAESVTRGLIFDGLSRRIIPKRHKSIFSFPIHSVKHNIVFMCHIS
jgi:hypothetical protein